MKKIYTILVIALSISLFVPAYMSMDTIEEECEIPDLNLPTNPVTLYVWEFPTDFDAAYKAEINGVNGDYDVTDGIYNGWCVDYGTPIPNGYDNPHQVTLHHSYYPPELLSHENWTKINYLINHKQGDAYDVQRAIWYFINFGPWNWDYTGYMTKEVTQETWNMIQDTIDNSDDWCIGCGDTIAVICDPGIEHEFQITFIEVPITCYEGATRGFWKNHIDEWQTLSEDDLIQDLFENVSIYPSLSSDSLMDALKYGGGPGSIGHAKRLLGQSVAAALNAYHSEISYPLSIDTIIKRVNDALSSEDGSIMESLKDELDMYNNYGYEEWW